MLLLPLGDDNPTARRPVVTVSLMVANVLAFLTLHLVVSPGTEMEFLLRWGFDAAHPFSPQLLTSLFLHAGWLHLVGNLIFLWIVGDNVEDKLGPWAFLGAYLVGGAIGCWAFVGLGQLAHGQDPTLGVYGVDRMPVVGASGAIATLVGIYLVFFPDARMRLLVWYFFFVSLVRVRARWVLGAWLAYDAWRTVLGDGGAASGGVATAAHLGGGLLGLLLGATLKGWAGGRREGSPWDVHTGFSVGDRSRRPGIFGLTQLDELLVPPVPPERSLIDLEDRLTNLVRDGHLDAAIELYPSYESHERERPLPADVQIELAHELDERGFVRDALRAYHRYLDSEPHGLDRAEAKFRIALLHAVHLEDREGAAPWFREVLVEHADPQVRERAREELADMPADD